MEDSQFSSMLSLDGNLKKLSANAKLASFIVTYFFCQIWWHSPSMARIWPCSFKRRKVDTMVMKEKLQEIMFNETLKKNKLVSGGILYFNLLSCCKMPATLEFQTANYSQLFYKIKAKQKGSRIVVSRLNTKEGASLKLPDDEIPC